MAKILEFKMDKQSRNKGFNMVESLLVVFIISMLAILFLSPFISRVHTDTSSVVYMQVMAMKNLKRNEFDKDLWFNENGNINQAQTKKIGGKTCIFNLGFGRFTCE